MMHPEGKGTTIPFNQGETVIERIGEGPGATNHETTIVEIRGNRALTQTGRYYNRQTGVRTPESDPYRSITGTAFARVGVAV